jgi:hypothetical protein
MAPAAPPRATRLMAPERRFEAGTLAAWRDEREVSVETAAADGAIHRTIIWIVVDAYDRVLIRSYRGATARWYCEALDTGHGAILLGAARVPVSFEVARDAERIAACSAELERKYAGDRSTPAMVREDVLDTTLEVLPEVG